MPKSLDRKIKDVIYYVGIGIASVGGLGTLFGVYYTLENRTSGSEIKLKEQNALIDKIEREIEKEAEEKNKILVDIQIKAGKIETEVINIKEMLKQILDKKN